MRDLAHLQNDEWKFAFDGRSGSISFFKELWEVQRRI